MEPTAYACGVSVVFLLFLTCDMGVLARAVDPRGAPQAGAPRAGAPRAEAQSPGRSSRWRRGLALATSSGAAADRERCAELSAPWRENLEPNLEPALEGNATLPLHLRVRPLSARTSRGLLLFPGKALFSFVRRVYRCCQERPGCGSVKGIPGRLRGGTNMEFLLTGEILSLTSVTRAELHLQLSNPRDVEIRPVLPAAAKRDLPTRYSAWSSGSAVELRVDLLDLLRGLQEEAAAVVASSVRRDEPRQGAPVASLQDSGGRWKDAPGSLPGRDLVLRLGCTRDQSAASCEGVQLLHTPFMAVYYS